MELIGKIVQVLPLRTGTSKAGNPWQVQEYILETLGTQYPRKVCFEVFGDNVNKFPMQVGQEVTVSIDVESREFNGRWYTDIRAWRVERGAEPSMNPMDGYSGAQGITGGAPSFSQAQQVAPQTQSEFNAPAEGDDLPF